MARQRYCRRLVGVAAEPPNPVGMEHLEPAPPRNRGAPGQEGNIDTSDNGYVNAGIEQQSLDLARVRPLWSILLNMIAS